MDSASAPAELRVLIVDDNQDAADTLAVLLELRPRAGSAARIVVRVAYDGLEGLQTAREFEPDCVVSDVRMPGLDGYELARAIRAESALTRTKLVALSAFSGPDHDRRATAAGFDYRLTKAGDVGELMEVLRMIEEIKALASRTQDLARQNVALAGQTKELLQEVKEDVRELKQEVRELKQEVQELKDEQNGDPAD